jgi:hypothetical protein
MATSTICEVLNSEYFTVSTFLDLTMIDISLSNDVLCLERDNKWLCNLNLTHGSRAMQSQEKGGD